MPAASSQAAARLICVDLPTPSPPSNVMNLPCTLFNDLCCSAFGNARGTAARRPRALRQCFRKCVPAFALARRDEEEFAAHFRLHCRPQRSGSRECDRRRRQPVTRVGIVRPVTLEISASQVAVDACTESVDDGRIGLQTHAPAQALDEDAGDARTLLGMTRLTLDDRRQDQHLVLVLERQVLLPRRPGCRQLLAHAVARLAQQVDVARALAEQVRVGKEKSPRDSCRLRRASA